MRTGLSLRHHHLYAEAPQHNHRRFLSPSVSHFKFQLLYHKQVPDFTPHPSLRFISKASQSRPNPSNRHETPIQDSDSPTPDPIPPTGSSAPNPFSLLLGRFREELKFDKLGMEIMSIALPAALALAADPITSLVDTAFVGHLGSVELAAVGVSISVFNLVSKLFNIPLLNITTSFVAEEQTLLAKDGDESIQVDIDQAGDIYNKRFLPSVSTSLALAAAIGIAETFALSLGSGFIMNTMGFTDSNTSRAVYCPEGFWCSSNCNSTSCTRNFSWI